VGLLLVVLFVMFLGLLVVFSVVLMVALFFKVSFLSLFNCILTFSLSLGTFT
jgi:hypothetical protein